MEKVKTVIDRAPISSDYIESKQNFGHVLSQVKNLKPPVWKSAWFYGPVGLAVIAVIVSALSFNPMSKLDGESVTVATQSTIVQHMQQPVVNSTPVTSVTAPQSNFTPPTAPETTPVITAPVEEEAAEEEPVTHETVINPNNEDEPRDKPMGILPHIGDVYNGEIDLNTLCGDGIIKCNDEIKIVAFNIHYNTVSGTDTEQVVGNKIPLKVCEQIKANNIGHMIFITDIKGVDTQGHVRSLTSLNFIPVK